MVQILPRCHTFSDLETITTVQVITKNGLPEKRMDLNPTLEPTIGRRHLCCLWAHSKNENFKKRNTLCIDTGCVYGGRLTAYSVEEDRLISVRASVLTAKRFSCIEYLLNHYGRHCHRWWHSHNNTNSKVSKSLIAFTILAKSIKIGFKHSMI